MHVSEVPDALHIFFMYALEVVHFVDSKYNVVFDRHGVCAPNW